MKTILFLGFALLLGLESFGQKYPPVQPYNESGYTKKEVEYFARKKEGALNANYRTEMLRIINKGLLESGEDQNLAVYPLTQDHISWIFSQISYERRILTNFMNSHLINGQSIEFFFDKGPFDGIVGVFKFGKCEIVLYKTICMNLLEVSNEVLASNNNQSSTTTVPNTGGNITVNVNMEVNVNCNGGKEQPVCQNNKQRSGLDFEPDGYNDWWRYSRPSNNMQGYGLNSYGYGRGYSQPMQMRQVYPAQIERLPRTEVVRPHGTGGGGRGANSGTGSGGRGGSNNNGTGSNGRG